MYENITKEPALLKAFLGVKKNRGCPGIDRQSVAQYQNHLTQNTRELARLLAEKKYRPLPVKRVYIPKANGKKRPLGIPAVRDRVVQQAVLDQIQPSLEPSFKEASFGFRPGKSAHQAISKIQEYLNDGYEYVVDADIKDFFGNLNHQILMAKVRTHISDRDITKLIYRFLTAGVMEEGNIRKQISGTPQGGIISPILANLYLNEFDAVIEKTDLKLVRYADDFVVLCKTVNQATSALKTIRAMLKRLKLEINEQKTKVTSASQGFNFLGHTFLKRNDSIYIFPSDKSVSSYKDKLRLVTRRQQPKNIKMIIETLNPIVRGWGNYFGHHHGKKRFEGLDAWTRMRLRSFMLKKHALTHGVHTKYPNAFFTALGLVGLVDILKHCDLPSSQTSLSL
jgi:group II intron reverse transcriptase/maturase